MLKLRFSFFCEDVRREFTGQITAVGIFGPRIVVPGFPTAYRSLAFHMALENPTGRDWPFRMSLDGPLVDNPLKQVQSGRLASGNGEDGNQLGMLLGGVVFREPGTVRVRVEIDSEPPFVHEAEIVIVEASATSTPPLSR